MITSWEALPDMFPGLVDSESWVPRLQAHAAFLASAAPRVKTTSVDPAEMIGRHYAESLELLRLLDAAGVGPPLVDVGPGGGFPGLVIAAVRPDWPIMLVEPLKKRAKLLEDAAAEMGLRHAAVAALRAEEAGRSPLRETAAVVTARAVAPLPELLEYCAPLAAVGGLLAFPKGHGWQQELDSAAGAMKELGCSLEAEVEMRSAVSATPIVLLVRKTATTAERYPRRPGIPRKRPL